MLNNVLLKIADTSLEAPNVDAGRLLNAALSIALWGIGIMSVVVIIYAAFLIVTARGDVEKAKKGRLAITWGMVGLIIAISASVIVSVVVNTAGGV
jgi:hypothetical protein